MKVAVKLEIRTLPFHLYACDGRISLLPFDILFVTKHSFLCHGQLCKLILAIGCSIYIFCKIDVKTFGVRGVESVGCSVESDEHSSCVQRLISDIETPSA